MEVLLDVVDPPLIAALVLKLGENNIKKRTFAQQQSSRT
jgi:hypothetical protein